MGDPAAMSSPAEAEAQSLMLIDLADDQPGLTGTTSTYGMHGYLVRKSTHYDIHHMYRLASADQGHALESCGDSHLIFGKFCVHRCSVDC